MIRHMQLLKTLSLAIVIGVITVAYWFLSHEAAGTAMLGIFAVAMALFSWVLVPTFNDVGPTAPVDADWAMAPAESAGEPRADS